MKHIFFTAIFYCLFFFSCAQRVSNPPGYAFYRESVPARPLPSIEGLSISSFRDTLHTIYVEMNARDTLIVDSVIFFGKKILPAVYEQSITSLFIGVQKKDGTRVELPLNKDKAWWRMELDANETRGVRKNGMILIKGRQGNKPVQLKLEIQTELAPEIRG